jgi:hypothetical protein
MVKAPEGGVKCGINFRTLPLLCLFDTIFACIEGEFGY